MFSRILLCLCLGLLAGCASSPREKVTLPEGDSAKKPACRASGECAARSSYISQIRRLHDNGVRPRFSPDGQRIIFDRKNDDGYFDLYISDLQGKIVHRITEGNPKIGQKHNGNGIFHPSGKYVVFISETEKHYVPPLPGAQDLGQPGIGLFNNLWATNPEGDRFWKLTDIPIKQTLRDGVKATATVNPHFSPDGKTLMWTERYGETRTHCKWGLWRVKRGQFSVGSQGPQLSNIEVLFTPEKGNYVTAMGFLDDHRIILAGNLDNQHEFGMDQYIYDPRDRSLDPLMNTPRYWEEDVSITPKGRLVFMSNEASPSPLDPRKCNWWNQPRERDYFFIDTPGGERTRLTYFNDASAPEYLGPRTIVAASDVSPDGKWLAATVGIDRDLSTERPDTQLQVFLIGLDGF